MQPGTRNKVSLRSRHLMIAGVAGRAAPASLFAAQNVTMPSKAPTMTELFTDGGEGKLVVSGRITDAPDGKPLAGAMLEAWHAETRGHANGIARGAQGGPDNLLHTSVTADADGRFVFTTARPAGKSGRPPSLNYQISHQGHAMPVAQLYLGRARGVPADLVANSLQRDDTGTWRATFGLTLAA